MLAGSTEIGIIADDFSGPEVVACDLLGQSEHDSHSGGILICLGESHARKVLVGTHYQVEVLPTRNIVSQSWEWNDQIIIAELDEEAVSIMNDYAPEHLELLVEDQMWFILRMKNYGSLFIGEEPTVAYRDKSIGTNHILPTSRAACYTGGVWVGKFLKTVICQRALEAASVDIAKVTSCQCEVEKMIAYALSAGMRIKKYGGNK